MTGVYVFMCVCEEHYKEQKHMLKQVLICFFQKLLLNFHITNNSQNVFLIFRFLLISQVLLNRFLSFSFLSLFITFEYFLFHSIFSLHFLTLSVWFSFSLRRVWKNAIIYYHRTGFSGSRYCIVSIECFSCSE